MSNASSSPLIKARSGPGIQLSVTPESTGWRYLSFAVVELAAGETFTQLLADQETAVVPLSGTMDIRLGTDDHTLSRVSVFAELAAAGYAPPGTEVSVSARTSSKFAIGSAPAEGRYTARLIAPSTIRSEIRGGGQALRQVNHTLAPPIEAERLILYEVYVPRGMWSGWVPHCHDGRDGSPYLEETYYFRLDRPEGFWMHRNWLRDGSWEQTVAGGDGDCATVPQGYHSSVACPGSNMYFLNFLAGDLIGDDRRTPPCFHSDHTWIQSDWNDGAWSLPIVTNGALADG